jgi:putative nucleotidyltransferase with HDIG domain
MSITYESVRLTTPAPLVETPFGFQAHQLDLSPKQSKMHRQVMSLALTDPRMTILNEFERHEDEGTLLHSLGVAWMAGAVAIELGHEERDAVLLVSSALTHDIGKTHGLIRPAVASKEKFEENPRLFPMIQHHPVWGSLMMRRLGFGPNEAMLTASHHGFQTDRDPYGILADQVRGFAEPDGYVPPTKHLAGILASADNYHALSVSPLQSGRSYLDLSDVSPIRALMSVSTLNVPRETLAATARVNGFYLADIAAQNS